MLLTSCYNIFINAYYAAFGNPEGDYEIAIDWFVEFLFLLDMLFCFCQEYTDQETYTIQTEFKEIAKHDAKGSFVFDLLAWIPFEAIILGSSSSGYEEVRLFRLFRLLRLPRLA